MSDTLAVSVVVPVLNGAKTIGALHGLGNVVVLLLFAASWLIRRAVPEAPTTTALILSFGGVALATVTGWLGGELVSRLGVGVDDGANQNAPSSLQGTARRTVA